MVGIAAGAGLVLAVWGIDLIVIAFGLAAAVICGLVFGLAPALVATRAELATVMKNGARDRASWHSPGRSALMIAQMALAVVLLTGAGLFVRSLRNVQAIDTGMDLERLLVGSVDMRTAPRGAPDAAAFYAGAVERVRALPGVETATLTAPLPLSRATNSYGYSIPGAERPAAPDSDFRNSPVTYLVGAHYFATVGTPIRQGRDFTDADREGSLPVAIVDEAFARREWPGTQPIGQCIETLKQCYTVVGIAANARYASVEAPPRSAFFLPLAQASAGGQISLLARTTGPADGAAASVRRVLQGLAPAGAYASVRTMDDVTAPELQPRRLAAAMFSVFGVVALLLAAVGLYGVLAYAVAQRTHEVGIRMALGARPRQVVALVLRQGAVLTATGLVIGIAGALGAARLIAHSLFGVSATDPLTFAGVCVVLAGVAVLASYIPARRATHVDPLTALRSE